MIPADQMIQDPAMQHGAAQASRPGLVAPQGQQELTMDDFETVIAAVSEQLHSEQMLDKVAQMFADAAPEQHPDAIAALAYKVVTDVMHQIEQGGGPIEYDFLAGVAAETIDMLIAIVQSVSETMPEEDLRELSFLKVVQLHGEKMQDDPEQQALAQQHLAEMRQSGDAEYAMQEMQRLQQKYGVA